MIIGCNYNIVHHQNHLLAEHSDLHIRTVWRGLCLGHMSASVLVVAAILTVLCDMASQMRNTFHSSLRAR